MKKARFVGRDVFRVWKRALLAPEVVLRWVRLIRVLVTGSRRRRHESSISTTLYISTHVPTHRSFVIYLYIVLVVSVPDLEQVYNSYKKK
jgi:hypothetical protein